LRSCAAPQGKNTIEPSYNFGREAPALAVTRKLGKKDSLKVGGAGEVEVWSHCWGMLLLPQCREGTCVMSGSSSHVRPFVLSTLKSTPPARPCPTPPPLQATYDVKAKSSTLEWARKPLKVRDVCSGAEGWAAHSMKATDH